jgi:hypothetical protein
VPDEISGLRPFARIVSAGSLSKTARRLDSSLSAVSRRRAAMESRLGARLIDRGSRHFVLTEEAGVLYQLRYFAGELAVGSTNSPYAGSHRTSPSHELGKPYAAGWDVINHTFDLTA